jgi:hypothetical protein
MPDWQSTYISEIAWDIRTSAEEGGGTDAPLNVEVMRDDDIVIALRVEPGETGRLDRGDSEFHWWEFRGTHFAPGDVVRWVGGLPYPDAAEFPDGISGSLKCRFRIFGEDMWIKDNIEAYVRYTEPEHVEGTIDSMVWVDDINWTHVGTFSVDANISADSSEGSETWTLIY